jgi:D-arabinose 1-dehydrogenase-like Zn-dependent alcohol dehydrogenase
VSHLCAVVVARDTPPAELATRPLAEPAVGPDELLVEVQVGLLGPEDLDLAPEGGVAGSEAVGIIAGLGEAVGDWHLGDRVALPADLPCGRCAPCRAGRGTLCRDRQRPGRDRDGWLASQVVVPADAVAHVPPELDAAQAASVPGAVATAYHALKRAGVGQDVTVVIIGGDTVATHLTQVAALAGGTPVVVDPDPDGRERALDLGADIVIDPTDGPLAEQLLEHLGELADRVVLTPAADVEVPTALALLRAGGRLVLAGRPTTATAEVPLGRLVDDELDIVGATGATPQDVTELFDLAGDGRLILTTAIDARFGLDELEAASAVLRRAGTLRVALSFR